jgi:ribulose-5-phosphate 4-epimerase/fuculose-1-phosphate aldolase
MHDDGVIKYTCHWQMGPAPMGSQVRALIMWRDRLWLAKQIGVYPNGIGYGNISIRLGPKSFLVSGTQTGHLAKTHPVHYTLVDDWDIHQNILHCTGPVKASSESLTHAALYDYSRDIRAIIHVHSAELWKGYRHRLPTTAAKVPYGTPAMAYEMWRLMEETDLPQRRILIMAGHAEGVLTFGPTLEDAAQTLSQYQDSAR